MGSCFLPPVLLSLTLVACTPADTDQAAARFEVLDWSAAAIAGEALSDQPRSEFLSARVAVATAVHKDNQAHARAFGLAAGRGAVLANDPRMRAARAESAIALGTSVDPTREADASAAQQSIDVLRAAIDTIQPGASSCDALGPKADACVAALLIIEVRRSASMQVEMPMLDASVDNILPPAADAALAQPTPAESGVVGVAPPTPAESGVVGVAPPTLSSGSCGQPMAAPEVVCSGPDLLEPSASKTPLDLQLVNGCGVVQSRLDPNDTDGYLFTPEKSDPVRVELSYTGVGQANVDIRVRSHTDVDVGSSSARREGPTEQAAVVFAASALAGYTASVTGLSVDSCQPYTLQVDTNYCTDAFEDNDSAASATELTFDAQNQVEFEATASSKDDDFYQFIPAKADPVRLTGSYTVPTDSALDLGIGVLNATGAGVVSARAARTTTAESWSLWVYPTQPGSVYRLQVDGSGAGCAAYRAKLDASACTDAFEDNDVRANAVVLPTSQDHALSVINNDDDHYDITSLAATGGSCTVTYTLPPESPQRLSLRVISRSGSGLTSAAAQGTGDQRSAQVHWTGAQDASVLLVQADDAAWCQPYTLRCE